MEHWQIMEKDLARKLSGWITPGSGNQGIKGDVRTTEFVVEAKWRASQTITHGYYIDLMLEWLDRLAGQADDAHREPVLAICAANLVTYCLVPRSYWDSCPHRLIPEKDIRLVIDAKQARIYARADWSYRTITFDGECESWIFLPVNDFVFLVNEERGHKEDGCQKKLKPEKTPEQLERENKRKDQAREKRKFWRKEQKARRKILDAQKSLDNSASAY